MKKILAITGITGSGKTALSIEIAKKFNGEVVSCDSRQVYRFLDIGTAKITEEEKQGIEHHMLDIVDPRENQHYDLHRFKIQAEKCIDEILLRGKLPILVGGTGLYSRAVIQNYSFNGGKQLPKYDCLQLCLVPPKEIIVPKIKERNQTRVENGMFQETQRLLQMGVSKEFLHSLGLEYRLNIKYLEKQIDIKDYMEKLFNETMQFIKRQRTWYRKESPQQTKYMLNNEVDEAVRYINHFLNRH
ncbi:MAG: hypothetical protein LBH47_01115 [Christensenellaceae bacterium]|jgi:tRNA dimethylallyltransferase|nr:hypothetical protein [Christensenellaceae bacterium]